MTKVFSVYVEVVARGEDKDTVQHVVEEQLEQVLGDGNVFVYETNELDESEVDVLARMSDTNDDDPTEQIEPSLEQELDTMEILREEKLSDELGV
jgi:hypothetical protein